MNQRRGFTLIELSLVLVIIGLLAGGIMVGRDLIQAATIRATVSQIQKYEMAVNTFRTKYNYLPGDIPADQAAQTGLITRGGGPGDGDGNGYIAGLGQSSSRSSSAGDSPVMGGEVIFFWTDLSGAGLIEGSFTDSTDAVVPACPAFAVPCHWSRYFPEVKTGREGYITAFHSNIPQAPPYNMTNQQGLLFEISALHNNGATPSLTVNEAYSIDNKIDDGMPMTGNIRSGFPGVGGVGSGPLGEYDVPGFMASPDKYCISMTGFPFGVYVPNAYEQDLLRPYNLAHLDSANCTLIIRTGI